MENHGSDFHTSAAAKSVSEIESLKMANEDLLKRLRRATLTGRAAAIELQVARDRIYSLAGEIERLTSTNSAMVPPDLPWRVIGLYLSLRRFIPQRVLALGARVVDWLAKRQ